MQISTEIVAAVVKQASEKMSDPNYAATLVGGFVQRQAASAQYVSSCARELGGPEAVVNTIFHAALISECFGKANGRQIGTMDYAALDHVANGDREATLKEVQPAIVEYLLANVDDAEMRKVLTLLALAMEWMS